MKEPAKLLVGRMLRVRSPSPAPFFLNKIAESNFEMKLMRGLAAGNPKGIVVLIP